MVVLAADSEQADVAAQLVSAQGRHAAWILYRDPAASLAVPMLQGGKLVTQRVSYLDVQCTGVALPSLKSAPRPQPAPRMNTCPMRVIASSAAMPKDLWNLATSNPRKFLQEWAIRALPGQHRAAVKDSWGFTQDKRAGSAAAVGLIRIDTAVIVPLLAVSGHFGVYLEPVAHHPAYPTAVVDWHKPSPNETWEQLRLRLDDQKAAYGLVLGAKQLGLRKAPGSGHTPKTLWQIAGTPVDWSDGFLHELIVSQTSASAPEVLRRQVRGQRCTWWVRASVPGEVDAHCLRVEAEGAEICLWMLPSTSKPPPRKHGKHIPQPASFALFRSPFAQVDRPAQATQAADSEAAGADGLHPTSAAKRQASHYTARIVPEGATVHQVPGDGACFFHAASKALKDLHGRDTSAQQIRAEVVAHMRRYPDAYRPDWDGTDDHGQGMESFNDYLTRMAHHQAWAGYLELKAFAKTFKVSLLVLPEDASHVPCAFGNAAHPPIAIWHTRDHFDLLLPSEGSVYPGIILGIAKEGPNQAIRRAGATDRCQADDISLASSAPTVYKRARHSERAVPPLLCNPVEDAPPDVPASSRGVGSLPATSTPSKPAKLRVFNPHFSPRKGGVENEHSLQAPPSASSRACAASAKALVPGAPSLASSTPTACKLVRSAAQPAGVLSGAPAPVTVQQPHRGSIKAFFAQVSVPPASAQASSMCVAGPAEEDGDEVLSQAISEPEADPPAPARVKYGKSGRFRLVRSWSCRLCNYKTPISAKWGSQKQLHIRAFHPAHRRALALNPRLPALQVPGPEDQVRWQCPCCPLALLSSTVASYDQAYAVRHAHRTEAHPQEPRELFVVKVPRAKCQANVAKATRAVKAAGVAKRLLQLKAATDTHDIRLVTLPWYTKHGKKARSTCSRALCVRCGAFAESIKRLEAIRCDAVMLSRTSGRGRLRARLEASLNRPDLSPDLSRGVRVVLDAWDAVADRLKASTQTIAAGERGGPLLPEAKAAAQPLACRAHDWDLFAWPSRGAVYVCLVCGATAVTLRAARCPGRHVWSTRRQGACSQLTKIATDGPAHDRRAARRLLAALALPVPAEEP